MNVETSLAMPLYSMNGSEKQYSLNVIYYFSLRGGGMYRAFRDILFFLRKDLGDIDRLCLYLHP